MLTLESWCLPLLGSLVQGLSLIDKEVEQGVISPQLYLQAVQATTAGLKCICIMNLLLTL